MCACWEAFWNRFLPEFVDGEPRSFQELPKADGVEYAKRDDLVDVAWRCLGCFVVGKRADGCEIPLVSKFLCYPATHRRRLPE